MSFTKLKKIHRYTDVICVGISVSEEKYMFSSNSYVLNLHGFHTIHLRPKDGKLHKHGDVITWDTDSLFDCLTNYISTGNNPLIVCNHTLVAIGSSDFTEQMDSRQIVIKRTDRDAGEFGYVEENEISTECFIASTPPTILMFTNVHSGKTYTMVDISNYGIDYISDVFDNLCNEDKPLVFNSAELGVSEDNSLTCAALIARFMQEFYRLTADHKLGGLSLTYSSQGMRAFRHLYYKENILTHTDRKAIIVERNCYTGGRVEERFNGHYPEQSYLLDIQSLYPHIWRTKRLPVELLCSERTPPRSTVKERLQTQIVGAWCRVETDIPAYPVKINNVLRFPTGSFNTYLIGEEFSEAFNAGHVTHIYHANFYSCDYVLKEYAEFMLGLRTRYKGANNRLAEMIIKLITNGTNGKFGQTGKCWVVDEREIADQQYGGYIKYDDKDHDGIQYRIIDWNVSRLESTPFAENTFIPIAACVNSSSRITMWRYMQLAGLQNILYVAVDGLIVNQEGYDRLEMCIARSPYEYGRFKIAESAEYCNIYGYGKYSIGNKVCSQGLPRKDSKIYSGFWNATNGARTISTQESASGKQVIATYKSSHQREILRSKCDTVGAFTAQDSIDTPIDLSTFEDVENQPSLFHSPEWLR